MWVDVWASRRSDNLSIWLYGTSAVARVTVLSDSLFMDAVHYYKLDMRKLEFGVIAFRYPTSEDPHHC